MREVFSSVDDIRKRTINSECDRIISDNKSMHSAPTTKTSPGLLLISCLLLIFALPGTLGVRGEWQATRNWWLLMPSIIHV